MKTEERLIVVVVGDRSRCERIQAFLLGVLGSTWTARLKVFPGSDPIIPNVVAQLLDRPVV